MNIQAKPRMPAPTDTRELREFLLDRIIDVADGRCTAEKAKSICNISQQVYNTVNVEIKMAVAQSKLDGQDVKPVNFGK